MTTSDVVMAGAAGVAAGRSSPRGGPELACCGASAFDLPPEDEMLDHEQRCAEEPCDVDDEDAFDYGNDMGLPAYHS